MWTRGPFRIEYPLVTKLPENAVYSGHDGVLANETAYPPFLVKVQGKMSVRRKHIRTVLRNTNCRDIPAA